MERITGNGAPTRTTVGVVGQHYEDLNTGNIYECLVASEHSKIHGPMMGGYIWKLKVTGEDLEDHAAIFGGGSGGYRIWQDDVTNMFTCNFSYDEIYQNILEVSPVIIDYVWTVGNSVHTDRLNCVEYIISETEIGDYLHIWGWIANSNSSNEEKHFYLIRNDNSIQETDPFSSSGPA